MKYVIVQTAEFSKWFIKQEKFIKDKISARLHLLANHGYFGIMHGLDKNLFELKWRTGIRVYFTLTGGNKNDQKKDIEKAKKLQKKYN